MSNLILLHGMSCHLEDCFGPSIEKYANERKIDFYFPKFCLGDEITLSSWNESFVKYKKLLNEHTVLICHSLSTNFIIKFLYKHKLNIGTLIAVAGGYTRNPRTNIYLKDFIPLEIEFEYAKANIKNIFHIYSDDDNVWTKQELQDYTKMLNANEIVVHNCGHFGRRSGIKEIPQIFDILDENIN